MRSFVDAGIKPLLTNSNNQVIYGRRGTGKTHLLKVLEPEASRTANTLPVYIDARTLGSTNQFSDPTLPLKQRCLSLFQDILLSVGEGILGYIINEAPPAANAALDRYDELVSLITAPVETAVPTSRELHSEQEASRSSGASVKLSASDVAGQAKLSSGSRSLEKDKTVFTIIAEENIVFPDLQTALRRLLETLQVQLVILLDEWSSIPIDLQPYLAEFLKRSIIPNQSITLKIASLEHRSQFSVRDAQGNILGFEIGADISASLDIDDYYVYDRNPKQISEVFADILFRHLQSDLGDGLEKRRITSGNSLVDEMFVSREAFQELARSAEGVVRDLINIFASAAIGSNRRQRDTIDRRAVLEAARQWYEQDKVRELGDDLRQVLQDIITEVIGNRRSRAFLIPRDLEKHPVIQRLFDARVLHLMHRGYADKDNPGVRYNIYSIDYGTYVDLLNTSKAPEIELQERQESAEFVVPFDDKRSIRRIILSEAILNRVAAR